MSLCCGTVCGGVSQREQCHLPASWPAFSHFLHYPEVNWALLALIPGWVGLCTFWDPWVSPTNSPVRLGVFPAADSAATGVFSQRFWGFISLCWSPGLHVMTHSPGILSGLSTHKFGTTWSASHCLAHLVLLPLLCHLPLLPVSAPPTSLNECFFFNSLCWTSIQFDFLAVLVIFCF